VGRADQVSDERRRLGAWYTPPDLVELVQSVSLDRVLPHRPDPAGLLVLDPACGTGNLLVAAADRLVRAGLDPEGAQQCLVGVDVDGAALAEARRRLPGARFVEADGLTWSPDAAVDVVVGNPPFLSPLRRRAGVGARGGARYADVAAQFLARWAAQLAPGGALGFVMPLSFLSTLDAAPIRAAVLEVATVCDLVAQTRTAFDAAVHTMVIGLRAGADASGLRSRPTWGHRVAEQFGLPPPAPPPPGPRVGDLASVTADFRDQFYGLVGAVADDAAGPRLVTSGLIGDGVCHWGRRPARFARTTYRAPRVELALLSPEMAAWATRRLVPKVLVASQARHLHAVVDHEGTMLPSVPVISVVPRHLSDLDAIDAALRDRRTADWARSTYLGAGMRPGTIKLSARQVAGLPLAWD
jgi:SAM-dependent methyltransferase